MSLYTLLGWWWKIGGGTIYHLQHQLSMQFILGDKGENLLDESVLPVTEKERRGEGKSSIGPRMKYRHANHKLNCPYTNKRCCLWRHGSVTLEGGWAIKKHMYTTMCNKLINVIIVIPLVSGSLADHSMYRLVTTAQHCLIQIQDPYRVQCWALLLTWCPTSLFACCGLAYCAKRSTD